MPIRDEEKEKLNSYLASKYPENYVDQEALLRADERKSEDELRAGLGGALNKITEGLSGAKIDSSYYDQMAKNADAPVKRETERQKMIREYLKDKYDSELKEKSYSLQDKQLENTLRHQRAMEGLQKDKFDADKRKEGQGSPDERKVATYLDEMNAAHMDLDNIRGQGFKREESLLASSPDMIKSVAGYVGAADKNMSTNDQAERRFINATLRRESGAAIGKSEYEQAEKQYFPRPGDSPEAIAQKTRNRIQKMESMKREAGPLGSQVGSPRAPQAEMVTIRNKKTGETKQVPKDEALKMGALK